MLEVTCSSSFLVKVQSDQGGGSHLHALPVFTQDGLKKFIANKAVEEVKSGMVLGFGTALSRTIIRSLIWPLTVPMKSTQSSI